MTASTIIALLLLATLASTASAHAPWQPHTPALEAPRVHYLTFLKQRIVGARDDRCLEQPVPRPVLAIATWNRSWFIVKWRDRTLPRVTAREARCSVPDIIRSVFGVYGDQAVAVSDCETGGTFWVGASNGQYLGIFQMGEWERATYGHGPGAWEQARAAYRYFVASGRGWSPWACKP